MEQWEIDFNWLKIQHFIKDKFKTPDLPKPDAVLFVIGLQELGILRKEYSHEQKLDITTLGTMTVLSSRGYFVQNGVDKDGWPLWQALKPYNHENETARNNELKILISEYFEQRYDIGEYEQSESVQ